MIYISGLFPGECSLTEAIALVDIAPSTHEQIPAEGMLQRSREMLIENAVQIVVIGAQVAFQLGAETCVGVINATSVVIPFPEFHGTHIRGEKDGAAKKRIQWRR